MKWAVGVGFLLSALFLWLALRQVNMRDLRVAFASIHYLPLTICATSLAFGIVLRAIRWRLIAGAPADHHRDFYRATNLGLLTNLLFPGRVGELVRVLSLAKLTSSTLPRPVASALIDRLVDVFVLLASAFALFLLLPLDAMLGQWFRYLLAAGVVSVIALALFTKSPAPWEGMLPRVARRLLQRLPLRPDTFLSELRAECRRLLRGWLSLEIMLLVVLIFCIDYAAIAALLRAFSIMLPPEGPLLLWVFLAAGSALPSAPGYIGVYQVAAVLALSFFLVPPASAVALATVLQLTTLGVALLLTGPSMLGLLKQSLVAAKSGGNGRSI